MNIIEFSGQIMQSTANVVMKTADTIETSIDAVNKIAIMADEAAGSMLDEQRANAAKRLTILLQKELDETSK